MKRTIVLMVMVALYMVTGCSEDDDNGSGTALQGEWHLVEISSDFGGSDEFEEGIVTWTFDDSQQEITVENNAVGDGFSGPESGTYDYAIGPDGDVCTQAMFIEDENYGCITLQGNQLKFSLAHVDGAVYTFTR